MAEAAEKQIQTVPYKSILQEHLGKRDLEKPTYAFHQIEGLGYIVTCSFEGKSFTYVLGVILVSLAMWLCYVYGRDSSLMV